MQHKLNTDCFLLVSGYRKIMHSNSEGSEIRRININAMFRSKKDEVSQNQVCYSQRYFNEWDPSGPLE